MSGPSAFPVNFVQVDSSYGGGAHAGQCHVSGYSERGPADVESWVWTVAGKSCRQ